MLHAKIIYRTTCLGVHPYVVMQTVCELKEVT